MSQSDYSTYSLKDLNTELRSRNAKTTGRKAELVERLKAYDRNFNFGQSIIPTAIETLHLPNSSAYKDVNDKINLPAVTSSKIECYLKQFGMEIGNKPFQMYYGRYLIYIRYFKDDTYYYIKAACRAEFKKKTRYLIDIIFEITGDIFSSQCECASGAAPTAHCKHICTVLVGLSAGHPLLTFETCTQQLQTFHKPQLQFTGSPVKSQNIPVNKYELSGKPTHKKICRSYDPRPAKYVLQPGYNDYVKNLCVNFSHNQPRMPILHLIEPANPVAIYNDHDYFKESPTERFLEQLKITKISKEAKISLELATRQQCRSKLWTEERTFRVQSSNFGKICKATERANLDQVAENICNPKKIRAKPIIHGRTYEETAIKKYEVMTGNTIAKCGIRVHNTYPYLGTSLDGLVIGQNRIIEVKCPYSARNMNINPDTVPYLEYGKEGELKLKDRHDYMYQIQGQLEITNSQECDLIIYTFIDTVIIPVIRNREFFETMLPKLIDFFLTNQKPAILKKCYYRNYYRFGFWKKNIKLR